jgi:predicted amino acid dehydrogenase
MGKLYSFSDINNFKRAVNISAALLDEVNPKIFFSPYSVIPVISQILGLNIPLMGTGDSPYSVTSIIFQLKEKGRLFKEIFKIPLAEKRKILDELYEMLAPLLLEDEDFYIGFLVKTKYKKELKGNVEIKRFKKELKDKFNTIRPFMKKFLNLKGDFGYIVHYGYPEDLNREYGFLRELPYNTAQEWRNYSYPIVNEILVKNFPGHKNINGWVIFVTNYTKELLEDSKLRKRKISQAAILAEKLGARIIGMGGLIASFAQGGYWLSKQMPKVGFTTGHAFTIGNIINIMKESAKRTGLNIRKSTIAIIGAGGSIGSGCARLVAEKGVKRIILIELSSFDTFQKLKELKEAIQKINPRVELISSVSISDIKEADLVIMATNSPTSILKSGHLKPGAIIIDDSFPKNVSREVLKKRKDIIILEGGIMQLPYSIDVYAARNMPDLMDLPLTRAISCKETYGCFAEILVLALDKYKGNYGLGYSDPKLTKDILRRAKRFNFGLAPLQCFDEAVEEKRINRVSRIISFREG